MPVIELKASDRVNNAPALDADEKLLHTCENTRLYFSDDIDKDEGNGTLYISTKNLWWLSGDSADKGFCVDFPSIAMHALSRAQQTFNRSCVYCQLDTGDDSDVSEMRLVTPEDQLQKVYQEMCNAAILNPDPEEEEDDDASNFFANWQEVHANLEQQQQDQLAATGVTNGVQELSIDPSNFVDAAAGDNATGSTDNAAVNGTK